MTCLAEWVHDHHHEDQLERKEHGEDTLANQEGLSVGKINERRAWSNG